MTWLVRNRILFFFLVLFLISGTTYFLIQIARGYRFDPIDKGLKAHGLLAIKSRPDGAKIYVNGKLKGATDTAIALIPGKYQINVEKDGFHPWLKLHTVQRELVTQSDVFLFPLIPSLQSLTYESVASPAISTDNSRLAYFSVSDSGSTGIWVYDIGGGLIDLNRPPRLVFDNYNSLASDDSVLEWSSDNKWVILKSSLGKNNFLINPNQINSRSEVVLRSASYAKYEALWNDARFNQNETGLKKLPPDIVKVLKENTAEMAFSTDNLKLLYTATASATIPNGLITRPPTASTQEESRQITPGYYYVYDYKEDKNFALPYQTPASTPVINISKKIAMPALIQKNIPYWLPSSNHLFWVEENEGKFGVWVCEYDGTNRTLVFSGDFDPNYVFTGPTMGKLIILSGLTSNLNGDQNLFSLDLLH